MIASPWASDPRLRHNGIGLPTAQVYYWPGCENAAVSGKALLKYQHDRWVRLHDIDRVCAVIRARDYGQLGTVELGVNAEEFPGFGLADNLCECATAGLYQKRRRMSYHVSDLMDLCFLE